MRYRIAALFAGVAAAAGLVVPAMASASSIVTPKVPVITVTASTAITGAPDSGDAGNTWALDSMTRNATLTRLSEVPESDCGGATATGHCYAYFASIHDAGVSQTVVGQQVPGVDGTFGATVKLGVQENVPMWGWANYRFYSDYKTLKPSLVPANLSENGQIQAGSTSTGLWPELFFQGGAQFWGTNYAPLTSASNVITVGGWHYTANLGLDSSCPNTASRWVDSSFNNWGSNNGDGNIFAPAAGSC